MLESLLLRVLDTCYNTSHVGCLFVCELAIIYATAVNSLIAPDRVKPQSYHQPNGEPEALLDLLHIATASHRPSNEDNHLSYISTVMFKVALRCGYRFAVVVRPRRCQTLVLLRALVVCTHHQILKIVEAVCN